MAGREAAAGEPSSLRSESEQQLAALLEAWRATHDPALEPAISTLGVEVSRTRGPLTAKSKHALEARWHEVAAKHDSNDLDRLLGTPWPATWAVAKRRIDQLAKFAPDPRMHVLAKIAADFPSYNASPLHTTIAQLLESSPTRLLEAPLAVIRATHHVDRRGFDALERVVANLTPTTADPTLIAGIRTTDHSLDALRAEHLQRPGDLALRVVLGDALQAAGDPRGELIALQLRGGPAARKRANEILRTHRDSLLGPLPGVVASSLVFERGFVTALRLISTPETIAASLDRPEWVTVEQLALSYQSPLPLITKLPLLRRLSFDRDEHVADLIAAGPFPSLEVLSCTRGHGFECPLTRVPIAAFPNLRVIGRGHAREFTAAAFEQRQRDLARTKLHALVHLGFPSRHLAAATALRHLGPPESRFTMDLHADSFEPQGWHIRLRRDSNRAELDWGGGAAAYLEFIPQIIDELLAGGITELAFDAAVERKVGALIGDRSGVHFGGTPVLLWTTAVPA